MIEEWKYIEGYENLYLISNKGTIKKCETFIKKINGKIVIIKEKILKPSITRKGYQVVGLSKEKNSRTFLVHRLVAKMFLPNPNNLPQINHKNEVKTDNRIENLEWCDASYNNNYGKHNERSATSRSKPVFSVDKITNEIIRYKSLRDAERKSGIDHSIIRRCCNGLMKCSNGKFWYYE